MTFWTAPASCGPLDAHVTLPGSKSLSARALHLAGVADAPSTVRGLLDSRDTRLFAAALEKLGVSVSPLDADLVTVAPRSKTRGVPAAALRTEDVEIDCGLAGTVMRFLPPLAALSPAAARFFGDEAANARPLAPLLDALTDLGALVTYEGMPGHLPFTIRGPLRVPESGWVSVDATASSQFLSALLLVAPLLDKPLEIRAPGTLVSAPHIDMTVHALITRGCTVERIAREPYSAWRITPGLPLPLDTTIEPDLSNAGPFLAAAMVCGGTIRVSNWPESTTQAGDAWRQILPLMGASITRDGADLLLQAPADAVIRGIDIDMSHIGELTPTLAAICAFADAPSRLRGIAHLRGHETDRLAAIAQELRACSVGVTQHADGLTIIPAPVHAAAHKAWGDHRMATFAAILALRAPGTSVDDIGATSKTLPQFPTMWAQCIRSGASR